MAYSVNNTKPLLEESESDEETNIQDFNDNDTIGCVIIRTDNYEEPLFKPLEPRDRYHLAFLIFYLLGIVTLLPWNFFITADDYWMYKFRDVNRNLSDSESLLYKLQKRTRLQVEFTSYISVASAVPNLVFLIFNTAISHLISINKRIIGSLSCMLILFIITLTFVNVNTDNWQNTFFIFTLVSIILLNVCSAILSGSLFGVVGKFSPIYITATIAGQALGGIFAALAEIVSLSVGASSTHSAFVYFTIGTITIVISIICYIVLTKTVFYKFYVFEKAIVRNEFQNELVRPQIISYKHILRKTWCYGLAMFSVFAITLSVYPGVTVLIESEGKGHGNKWNDVFFVPTIAYLLFSVGDYLGRILAGKLQKPKKSSVILILSLARFIFIPLLMLCNAQPRYYWGVVFDRDYQYILILFACALSNGYLANIAAIHAPRMVEHYEKEVASSMMTIFMGFGLALGSAISLIMIKLL